MDLTKLKETTKKSIIKDRFFLSLFFPLMNRHILIGLWIVFLLPIVSAELIVESAPVFGTIDADRIHISSNPIIIEACTVRTYTATITNRNTQDIYLIPEVTWRFRGIPKEWVTIVDEPVLVPAGVSEEAKFMISVPCGVEGNRRIGIDFNVAAPEPFSIKHTQTVQLTRTPNILASTASAEQTSCPCEPLEYTITVQNNGAIADVYDISTNRHSQYITILPTRFTLEPGQSQQVRVVAQFPCERYGTFAFSAIIETNNAGFRASLPLTSTINRCYDFTITGPDTLDLCADASYSIEYQITNNAAFQNSFNLQSRGQGSLSGEFIELQSDQTGSVFLDIMPTRVGNRTTEIIATSNLGSMRVDKPIAVNTALCYDIQLEVEESFAGVRRHAVCSGDESFPVYLRNVGIFNETVQLSLESSSPGVSLTTSKINITTEDLEELSLLFDHAQLRNRFTVDITAQIENNSRVSDSIQLRFSKQSDETCYAIDVHPKRVRYSEEVIPLTITNTGLRFTPHTLYLEDTQNVSTITPTYVELAPQESVVVNLTANVLDQRSHTIRIVSYVRDATFVLPVRIQYKSSLLPWILLGVILLLLLLLLLLIFLLFRKRKRSTKKEKKTKVTAYKKDKKKRRFRWLWLLLLLLLILLLIGAYFGYRAVTADRDRELEEDISDDEHTNETISDETTIDEIAEEVEETEESEKAREIRELLENTDTSPFEYQVLNKNSIHIIDLSKVFYDPDGDELVFTAVEVENITFSINSRYIIMKPEEGFYGIRYTQFTATDPHNLSASSPEIQLIVSPDEASRAQNFWRSLRVLYITAIY